MLRESKTPTLHTELFQRHLDNPILTALPGPYGVQCRRLSGGR